VQWHPVSTEKDSQAFETLSPPDAFKTDDEFFACVDGAYPSLKKRHADEEKDASIESHGGPFRCRPQEVLLFDVSRC
jgi:hypothetical protein